MDALDATTFDCCGAPQLWRRPLPARPDRRECLQLGCSRCGAERPVYAVHFALGMRLTACALPVDGAARAITLLPTSVSCPDCVLMLVGELAIAPIPDWRPGQSLAEDYYAS